MAWLARHVPARDQADDFHHQRHRIHEHEPDCETDAPIGRIGFLFEGGGGQVVLRNGLRCRKGIDARVVGFAFWWNPVSRGHEMRETVIGVTYNDCRTVPPKC